MTTPTPAVDTPRQERRDFVRAFAEHMWVRPGTDRPTVKPQTVVTLAALAAFTALLIGVAWEFLSPTPTVAGPVAPAPPPTAYAVVAGWDCSANNDHGFDVSGRTSAWHTVARGGWDQDGCHGSFQAIPMSGDASKDDVGQFATWWFLPGAAYSRCDLSVYVPRSERPQDVGAKAAQFFVLAGRGGAPLAQFVIDQTATSGRWVPAGTYPSREPGLAVRVVNRGVPPGVDARLAVAQVKIVCTH